MDDLLIDLGFVTIEANLLVSLIMQFAPIDTLNSLYDSIGLPAISDPIDCTVCGEDCCPRIVFGTGDELEFGVVTTITSAWVAGPNRWYIGFEPLPACDCVNYTITITNCTRSNGWLGGAVQNCLNQAQWTYQTQTNPNGVYTAYRLNSLSSTVSSFSMDVLIEEI